MNFTNITVNCMYEYLMNFAVKFNAYICLCLCICMCSTYHMITYVCLLFARTNLVPRDSLTLGGSSLPRKHLVLQGTTPDAVIYIQYY